MSATLPISYADARGTCKLWAFHIKKSGPASFEMTPAKYAGEVVKLEKAAELFAMIEQRRAAREAGGQG